MNDQTQQQLLGYLLGALDDAERDEVERQLEANPSWQDELQSLMASLEPLAESYREVDPPPNLAERTCAVIAKRVARVTAASSPLFENMRGEVHARNRWTIADVVVAAGIYLAAALLFFPVIAQSRTDARLMACQKNLSELGYGLISYSDKAGRGYFPRVPTDGNRAFAGVYGPTLVDGGYLTDANRVICPSSSLASERGQWKMPTLAQLDEASGAVLSLWQRYGGGTYGYSLGVILDGEHQPAQNQGRSYYALMADTPMLQATGYRSVNHDGLGQNILFEDGHVKYVIDGQRMGPLDHPYQNRLGRMEAGIDVNDAVIAPSATPPFSYVSTVQPSISGIR